MNNNNNHSFPYTNPYLSQVSQPDDGRAAAANNSYNMRSQQQQQQQHQQQQQQQLSLEDALGNLERSGSGVHLHPNLQALLKASGVCRTSRSLLSSNDLDSSSSASWSVSQVLRFTEWVLSQSLLNRQQQPQNNSRGDAAETATTTLKIQHGAIFSTVATLIKNHHWEDLLVYAAATYRRDDANQTQQRTTLLTVLMQASICVKTSPENSQPSLQWAALMALSAVWNSLDRLQRHCELGSAGGCSFACSHDDGAVWWLQQEEEEDSSVALNSVVDAALAGLVLRQEEWQQQMMMVNDDSAGKVSGLCDFKTSCASILCHLLRHQHTEWLHNQQQQQPVQKGDWARKLLQESSRLNDANMPVSTYTLFSLQCLELLTVLQWQHGSSSSFLDQAVCDEFKRFLQTTAIVPHVIAATFFWSHHAASSSSSSGNSFLYDDGDDDDATNNSNGPRWTQQPSDTVQQQSLAVLRCMYRASPAPIASALSQQPCTQRFVKRTWKFLLLGCQRRLNQREETQQQQQQVVSNEQIGRFLFLHATCRQTTRETILEALLHEKKDGSIEETCCRLLAKLLDWTRRNHSIQAAALLKQLLVDRLDPVRHDKLSRSIWQAVVAPTERYCLSEQCMELIVELASSSNSSLTDYHLPTLLNMLDTAYILLTGEHHNAQLLLASLSAQTVEALVHIMSPKQVCVDVNVMAAANHQQHHHLSMFESDESTPPVHNLSRLDTSMSLMVEEEARVSRGWDPWVRMAAATLLAVVGNCTSAVIVEQGNRVALLRGRVLDAANSFVADMQLSFVTPQSKLAVGVDGGQDSLDMTRRRLRLLTSLATADNEDYLASLVYAADTSQRRSTSDLHRRLERSNEALKEYIETEKRLVAEKESYAARLTAQAVTFQRERIESQRGMTRNANELVEVHAVERQKAEKRVRELSNQLTESQQTAQACRDTEAQVRSSLAAATAKLSEVSTREQDLAKRVERSESELQRVSGEFKAVTLSLNNTVAKEKELRQRISDQHEHIDDLEHSEGELRDSLENLFGDMVSLARLYVVMEKKEATLRENDDAQVEKLKQRLEAERQRNSELEERNKRNQFENEVLSKKYARAKEKLEKERDDRRKEDDQRRKRSGPVSYINQLHNASTSTSDRSASRKGPNADGGKENSSTTSSSLQISPSIRRIKDTSSRRR